MSTHAGRSSHGFVARLFAGGRVATDFSGRAGALPFLALRFHFAHQAQDFVQAKTALSTRRANVRQASGIAIAAHRGRTHAQQNAGFMQRQRRIGQAFQKLRARFDALSLPPRASPAFARAAPRRFTRFRFQTRRVLFFRRRPAVRVVSEVSMRRRFCFCARRCSSRVNGSGVLHRCAYRIGRGAGIDFERIRPC